MVRAVAGGIDTYIEDADSLSPSGSVTRDTRRIERTLIVNEDVGEDNEPTQDAINALVNECFPLFKAPGRLPVAGSLLFVDSLDIEPIGGAIGVNGGLGAYRAWKAKIVYTPLPYKAPDEDEEAEPSPLDLLERTWQGGGQYVTLPGTTLYWAGDNKPIGDEVPATTKMATVLHTFTRHHLELSQIPYDEMKSLVGRVNRTKFASTHPIFPNVEKETLLFEGFNVSHRYTSTGEYDYRLTLNFQERTSEWNVCWRREQNSFQKVFTDLANTDTLYYPELNSKFDELFGF